MFCGYRICPTSSPLFGAKLRNPTHPELHKRKVNKCMIRSSGISTYKIGGKKPPNFKSTGERKKSIRNRRGERNRNFLIYILYIILYVMYNIYIIYIVCVCVCRTLLSRKNNPMVITSKLCFLPNLTEL